MLNNFNAAMKKAYKAYNLTTPAQKLAFRTFCAEACLELAGEGKGIMPDRAITDEAASYAHRVRLAEEEIALNLSVGAEPYHVDTGTVLNEYRPRWGSETSTDAVRAWINWYGLRK